MQDTPQHEVKKILFPRLLNARDGDGGLTKMVRLGARAGAMCFTWLDATDVERSLTNDLEFEVHN